MRAREEIRAIIRTKTRDEWYDLLVEHDVCVGTVYAVEEVFGEHTDEVLRELGMKAQEIKALRAKKVVA